MQNGATKDPNPVPLSPLHTSQLYYISDYEFNKYIVYISCWDNSLLYNLNSSIYPEV